MDAHPLRDVDFIRMIQFPKNTEVKYNFKITTVTKAVALEDVYALGSVAIAYDMF